MRLTVEGAHSEQANASATTPSLKQTSAVSTTTATATPATSFETVSTVSIRRACKTLIDCLKIERDWSIMQFVLKELPNVLQNKAVLKGTDMDSLAQTLINLVSFTLYIIK